MLDFCSLDVVCYQLVMFAEEGCLRVSCVIVKEAADVRYAMN